MIHQSGAVGQRRAMGPPRPVCVPGSNVIVAPIVPCYIESRSGTLRLSEAILGASGERPLPGCLIQESDRNARNTPLE